MAIEIKAPSFPESVADGTVATWHKKPGDAVKRDELIVDIETDKVVMEVLAEADGVVAEIVKNEGDTVLSGELLGRLTEGGAGVAAPAPAAAAPAAAPAQTAAPAAAAGEEPMLAPAARKLAEENGIDPNSVKGSGKGGRVTKEDVVAAIEAKKSAPAAAAKPSAPAAEAPIFAAGERVEKRVPMTRLRAKVAERLVEAQSSMAMLTTFNEVDMTEVMALRSKYKDLFEKTHNGVRLGFMSFFVKASVEALKRFPAVNASIDGTDIVYHGYQDIGVAVSSDRGLVVPVLRNAEL
ncbi:2-oxo acid dehydrogenase subunit E2, partial [Pseudomonas kuykendallii]|uniref:2-oxo acid dehydrogenase subunit E2 n=2 Tax=Pseudomonas TaxID=286 RepID=UPI0028D73FA3